MASASLCIELVVAADEANGIGKSGRLPWRLAGDLRRFRTLTTGRGSPCSWPERPPGAPAPPGADAAPAVVMGRKTWQSIDAEVRPLAGRLNVVLTRDERLPLPDEVMRAAALPAALSRLAALRAGRAVGRVFVIGGGEIFAQMLPLSACRCVHLTRVEQRFQCDTHLPPLPAHFRCLWRSALQRDGSLRYRFETYGSDVPR